MPTEDIVKYAYIPIARSHGFVVFIIRFSIVKNHIVGFLNVLIRVSTPKGEYIYKFDRQHRAVRLQHQRVVVATSNGLHST